jgi:sporulation protein YlmC with PRC-barrel domain
MLRKLASIALVGTLLLPNVTFAQSPTKDHSETDAAVHKEGQWRSSKLIGVDVYNDANEKIGDIAEIIIDKSSRVENVILGVGGFLGMGEHYVSVPMDNLKWVNEPARNNSTAAVDKPTVGTNNAGAATGEVNRSNRPMRATDEKWYPDHAVYSATRDQLKSMPQFRYN